MSNFLVTGKDRSTNPNTAIHKLTAGGSEPVFVSGVGALDGLRNVRCMVGGMVGVAVGVETGTLLFRRVGRWVGLVDGGDKGSSMISNTDGAGDGVCDGETVILRSVTLCLS